MRFSNAQNMAESNFWEKIFSNRKCRKYVGNSRFCRFSSDYFLIFRCFFHTKTLLLTVPTIKHGSIVYKTDFCSRNFLKVAGTADFRRKNGISWISRAELYIFSWNFAHRCKMAMSKMRGSPIFENIFSGWKCRKYAGNRRFCRFSSDFFLKLCCFFTQKHYW